MTRTALLLLTLGALWFILCRQLSGEWTINEQYNYGWFVPFLVLYLFWLRWEDRPREIGNRKPASNGVNAIAILIAAGALALLLPIRLFEIGNPDWRPLGWIHTGAVAAFTLLVIWCAGGKPWLRHFAFPIGFFFVAVPWISPIEQPIVQGLMRIVAAVAAETASLCGIPAQLEGSLIRVSNGLVGVNEACSGVRSLQTSLMIGLLFGELKRLSAARRVLLLAGALAIAFLANCFRAFFLVWIAATQNISAVDRWHNVTGYLIVTAVFAGSVGLAALLGRKGLEVRDQKSEVGNQNSSTSQPSSTPQLLLVLSWIVLVEIGAEAWYRSHELNMIPHVHWTARWPESTPGFREIRIDEGIRSTLRFDEGREASWPLSNETPRRELDNKLLQSQDTKRGLCSLFFFRWNPGTSTILRARAHRPDICLPNTGWKTLTDNGLRDYRIAQDFALPFRHFSFVRDIANQPQRFAHAFFCMREDF
ncbi:MAG: hypothetical protein QOE73_878, partial [Verrucomicrobiota bacterium]